MRGRLSVLGLVFTMAVLVAALAAPGASAAGQPSQARVIVTFAAVAGASAGDVRASVEHVVAASGGTVTRSYDRLPLLAVRVPLGNLESLSALPGVQRVEADGVVRLVDAELDNSWGVKRIGAGLVHPFNRGAGIRIAIVDTGVDATHFELDGNFRGGFDFVNDDPNPADDHGHGTHVSGIACAEDNGSGVVGVAPLCDLYAYKVLDATGSGLWSDVIAAIDRAMTDGIDVVNMSLGATSAPLAVRDAMIAADAAGIVLVAAAGNRGHGGAGSTVDFPAAYPEVIAVAATTDTDLRASFSSTGPDVELAAPGVSIVSTLRGGGFGPLSGTSMASPHAAGLAALVIAAGIADGNGNGRINDDVRTRLQETADDLGAAGRDVEFGYGILDADGAVPPPPVNTPPSVTILSPAPNAVFASGTVISFAGSALDAEDGDISGALIWTSSIDGPIGLGAAFTRALTLGVHTVTAAVTDSGGLPDAASIAVTIIVAPPPPPAPVPQPVTFRAFPPSAITVERGTLLAGDASRLANDDGSTLRLQAVRRSGVWLTEWYGSATITGGLAGALSLSATYDGAYDTSVTQEVYLYNFSAARWDLVRSHGAGEVDVTVQHTTDGFGFYVAPDGEVRMRLRATHAFLRFEARADFMRFVLTSGSGPLADYYPVAVSTTLGGIVSGDPTSLFVDDAGYLVVSSARRDGEWRTDWTGRFALAHHAFQIAHMSVAYDGGYSVDPRPQDLLVFDHAAGDWVVLDSRGPVLADETIEWSTGDPERYISPAGDVLLRVRAQGALRYDALGDLLRVRLQLFPPDIHVSPLAACGQTVIRGQVATSTFTIANLGLSPLTFSLTDREPVPPEPSPPAGAVADWLTATPSSGTVAPAGSSVITITADTALLDVGTSDREVVVGSNDPDEPTLVVLCTVQVLAPVDAGADQTVDEGSTARIHATFEDPGFAGTHSATIAWGDATSSAGTVDQASDSVDGSHAYADNGAYTVDVTVVRVGGATVGSDTLAMTVRNVAPVVTPAASQSVDAGAVLSLAVATFTDAGSADTHTASIVWGDGTAAASASVDQALRRVTASHTYAAAGTFTATVTVRDDDGGTGSGTFTVVVAAGASASVDAGADQTVDEGQSVAVAGSYTDPGFGGTHGVNIGWGDGTPLASAVVDQAADTFTLAKASGYADNGVYTATATVFRVGGASIGSDTLTMTVRNVAPVVTPAASQSADVGSVLSLAVATFTDAGSADTHTASIVWGDGTPAASGSVDQPLRRVTASHTYAAAGTFTATVTVRDDDGGTGSGTFSVVVSGATAAASPPASASTPPPPPVPAPPAAPAATTVSVTAPASSTEGATVAMTASYANVSGTGTVAWGDGVGALVAFGAASGSFMLTHVYADDGAYTVSVCVSGICDTTPVTVANAPPALGALQDLVGAQGAALLLAGGFTDPGADAHVAMVDWGDGTTSPAALSGGRFEALHAYADAGSYTARLCVADDDGGEACATTVARITNAPPTVTLRVPADATEGAVIYSHASVKDGSAALPADGSVAASNVTFAWGDGSTSTGVTLAPGSWGAAHVYADNGTHVVRACVADAAGAVGCAETNVTIANAAPVVVAVASPADVVEGATLTLAGTVTDQGAGDTLVATVDWGDGTSGPVAVAAGGLSAAHAYADNGAYTISVCARDDDGGEACAVTVVNAVNAAPVLQPMTDTRIAWTGQSFSVSELFTDAGWADSHRALVSWGDGTVTAALVSTYDPGSPGPRRGALRASHAYGIAGAYTVAIEVLDDDGAVTHRTIIVNVSPAGAEPKQPDG